MMSLNHLQVKNLMDNNPNVVLINTLDEEHFSSTEIPGAINVPQNDASFVDRVRAIAEPDANIVVYCANEECQSSAKAVQKLETAGFTFANDFEAGARGWKEAGYELVAKK